MRKIREQKGFLITIEAILIATIMVIGLIVGWHEVRNAVVTELADVGQAIGNINQSYSFAGATGHSSSTAGSQYIDTTDFCDVPVPAAGSTGAALGARCVDVSSTVGSSFEGG